MDDDAHDFSWQPHEGQRRCFLCLAISTVVACAALGFVLGKIDPLQSVITAIERNGVPLGASQQAKLAGTRLSGSYPQPDHAPQAIQLAKTAPSPADQAASQLEIPLPPPVILLNAGAADQPAAGAVEPGDRTSSPPSDQHVASAPSKSQLDTGKRSSRMQMLSADRDVLVVVRRTMPPYDRKILRGRIRDGRLMVNRHDRRGMTLRY